jgi:hypothetical protein
LEPKISSKEPKKIRFKRLYWTDPQPATQIYLAAACSEINCALHPAHTGFFIGTAFGVAIIDHHYALLRLRASAAFLSHFDALAGLSRYRNRVIATQPPCDSVNQNCNRRSTRFPRASVDFLSSNNPVAAHPLLPSPKSGHSSLIATSFCSPPRFAVRSLCRLSVISQSR